MILLLFPRRRSIRNRRHREVMLVDRATSNNYDNKTDWFFYKNQLHKNNSSKEINLTNIAVYHDRHYRRSYRSRHRRHQPVMNEFYQTNNNIRITDKDSIGHWLQRFLILASTKTVRPKRSHKSSHNCC